MRRPLVFIAIFCIFGITAAELFCYFPFGTIVLSILVLIIISCINRYTGKPLLIPLLIMVTALSFGFSYMSWSGKIPADDISDFASGEKMTITGTVDEPLRHYSQRVTATLKASAILKGNHEAPVSGRVRLTIYDPETNLEYGDAIRFTGRLKKIRGFKNPGIFDYAVYVSRKGIRAGAGLGKKEGISKTGEYGNPLLKKIYRWREEIRLSIIHGLSISGSHLGFVTFLTFFITRYLLTHLPYRFFLRMTLHATPSKIAALVTMPPIIFYSFLSGGEVATIRSLIMAIVFLLAILIEKDDDSISTLAIAALIVLIWDPQGLFDISFQLSYTAVLSMIMTVRMFNDMSDKQDITKGQKGWRRKSKNILTVIIIDKTAVYDNWNDI